MSHLNSLPRLFSLIIIVMLIAGCGTQAVTPTEIPTSPASTPTPTQNPARPQPDVPIYKNSFENITDLTTGGITSANNNIRLNTDNVDYQSGKHSLETYGTISASRYSALTMDFSMKKLAGITAIDLSNKTVGFSFFIPAGSPIDTISLVARIRNKQVVLASAGGFTRNQGQGTWHYQQLDLRSVYENNAWIWTDLSNDEARQVVKNCETITIAGTRVADGEATATSFFIDDFKWITESDANIYFPRYGSSSLHEAAMARGMLLGGMLFPYYNDPWYLYTLAREFNLTTAGVANFPTDRPTDINSIQYDYTMADQKFAFAEKNGMLLEGGTGADHSMLPQWILDASDADLKTVIVNKVKSDVTHYKGKVLYWGVMNEVLDDDGISFRNKQNKDTSAAAPNAPYGYRYSPWVDGNDTSLIEDAFIAAHEADPNPILYLNEFNVYEIGTTRSDFFYNFVTDMKNRGVPIGGVGFEFHLAYPTYPGFPDLTDLDGFFNRVDQNIKRYAEAGFKVMFTEVECQVRMDDLDLTTQAGQNELARRQQKQAEVYAKLTKLAVDNPNVAFITFWYLADKPNTSAFNETYTDSYLFDKNYEPKPAYNALLNVLRGQ